MAELTPKERSLRARRAANARIARPDYSPGGATAPARRRYWQKYEAQVDPTGELSQADRERKAKALWQADMDRAKLRTVYPGMDAGRFAEVGESAACADPDSLVWVGRVEPAKDLVSLLHAFAEVRKEEPKTRLRIVGTPAGS